MKKHFFKPTITALSFVFLGLASCSSDDDEQITEDPVTEDTLVIDIVQENFTGVTITTVPCTLSDGTVTDCYQIVTTSAATDHQMGPWCPDTITDSDEEGGIWLESGQVYDVDGAFIENLATFITIARGKCLIQMATFLSLKPKKIVSMLQIQM